MTVEHFNLYVVINLKNTDHFVALLKCPENPLEQVFLWLVSNI